MKNKTLLLLLIILGIAVFFRLWQLAEIPPGLYPDVAIYGNDGLDTFQTGNFRVFYPENNGREGLFIWLLALSFSIFGISIWSIKIVTAVIGILTVFGLYLLAKEIFSFNNPTIQQSNSPTVIALLSSFFLAISFWHVNFSRIGFRAILLPFILVFAFYFLFKGFRQKRILDLVISGIFFGLGFYTYISYRFIILLLPLVLISFWFIYQEKKLQKKFLFLVSCFLLFVFLVALPIGIYFLENPQYFVSRAAGVSVFTQENPIKSFFLSLAAHLAMFNFYGDPNWRHNFAGSPMIFWPIGILFLIGFIFSLKEFLRCFKTKNFKPQIPYFILLSWFFVMLLPGILTAEGIPHALRTIGVIPAVYIFAGMGGNFAFQWAQYRFQNKKFLLIFILTLFFVFVTFAEFYKFFVLWAKNPEVEGAFTKKFADIGYYSNSLPEDYQKYVIVNEPGVPVPFPNGIPMPAQTVMFIENMKYTLPQSTYLLPENLDQIKIENRKTIILPMKYDENLANELKRRFPQGEILEEEGIWIYQIDG